MRNGWMDEEWMDGEIDGWSNQLTIRLNDQMDSLLSGFTE